MDQVFSESSLGFRRSANCNGNLHPSLRADENMHYFELPFTRRVCNGIHFEYDAYLLDPVTSKLLCEAHYPESHPSNLHIP